jgi:uncharacterized protein (DUF1778 family)
MSTKSSRWETRVSPETDDQVTRAAALVGVTKSQFVSDAARAAADDVLGRTDVTWMDPELFESMVSSLDTPDPVPPRLRRAAKAWRFSRLG